MRKTSSTLLLIEGKGNDMEEDDAEYEAKETKLEEEPIRKKCKVIIARSTK